MHFDVLKRPIFVGDTILFKGPYAGNMDTVGKVIKINPKSVKIEYPATRVTSPGKWNSQTRQWEGRVIEPCVVTILRRYDMLVINEQLPASEAIIEQFKLDNPHFYL